MKTAKVTFGFICGVLYIFVEGMFQLIMTPLLLRKYSADEVGFWTVVFSFTVLVQICQAGVGPVAVRMVASAKTSYSYYATCTTIQTSYKIISAGACLILAALYFIYIQHLGGRLSESLKVGVWLCFATSLVLKIYAWHWLHIVNGLGEVGWDKMLMLIGSVVGNGMCMCAIIGGLSMSYTALAMMSGSVIFWLGSIALIRHVEVSKCLRGDELLRNASGQSGDKRKLFRQAFGFFVLNFAGYFVLNADIIIVERLFGVSVTPYFGFLVKLSMLVITVSTLYQYMAYPFIAKAWASKEIAACRKYYSNGVLLSLSTALLQSVFIIWLAPKLVPVWLGPNAYLGDGVYFWQMVFAVVSVNTISSASPALATGEVSFIRLAVLSAICCVPFSILFGYLFGISGVPFGNALGTLVPSYLHFRKARSVFFCHERERIDHELDFKNEIDN